MLPRLPIASVCTALLRGCQSASGTTTRSDRVCNTKPFADVSASNGYRALLGPHLEASPAAPGRARGREAQNTERGPQSRARPARSPPCPRGPADQPWAGRGRPAAQPAAPGSACSDYPRVCPACPCSRGPDVGSATCTALTPCLGRPLASAGAGTTAASAGPAYRNELCGPQPGVRRGRVLR